MLKNILSSAVQGVMGNLSEMDLSKANQEYGKYLITDEKITNAFMLVRDVVLFTSIRIIIIDKQGVTGQKTSVKSILLMNIVDVSMETAGVADDSEINISYIQNAKRNSLNTSEAIYKLEFPKKIDIIPLYKYLYEIGYSNRLDLNEIK